MIVSSSDGDGMMDDGVVGCLVGEGVVVVDMVGGCGEGGVAGVEIGGGIVATVVVDVVVLVQEHLNDVSTISRKAWVDN